MFSFLVSGYLPYTNIQITFWDWLLALVILPVAVHYSWPYVWPRLRPYVSEYIRVYYEILKAKYMIARDALADYVNRTITPKLR
jgi:hypothetical protein